ncbi:MAG: serine protease, partial [Flavobacteriaceae bacterium]
MKSKLQLILSSILSGFIAVFVYQSLQDAPQPQAVLTTPQTVPVKYLAPSTLENADFIDAAAKTIDGVVHVKNISSYGGSQSSWLRNFYGNSTPQKIGTGSGVVVSPDGYIITNYHVIEAATDIE